MVYIWVLNALRRDNRAIFAVAAAAFAIHLYTDPNYGYFTDELYYLACSRHLAWGYVDQPPLVAVMVWLVRITLGQSLWALRLLPALAAAGEAALAALITRAIGGGGFAQVLAGLCVLCSPGILSIDSFFSMNAFEPLIWLGCAWLVIRMVNTGNTRLWIWFGLLAGIGLENKYSMLIFGAGIVIGLMLTEQRRLLWTPWLLVGGAIAFLIFLPNLIWNIQHHFPFLELQANIRRSGRDVVLDPAAFFGQEILAMHPLSAPIWIAGLWFFFRAVRGKPYRSVGWAWVFTAVVVVTMSPRIYYLFAAFPLLFAGGAVIWEGLIQSRAIRAVCATAVVASAAVLAPLTIPLLAPEDYIRYSRWLHASQPKIENHALGPLPQVFADRFGWPEMAATVARAYNSLPPEVRAKTAIFAQNYGQAGAIDLFGPKYGLPPAISGHQTYFLWGPRGYSGESMLVMDASRKQLEGLFSSVEKVARVEHPYSMPYQHFDVYYCRGLRQPLAELWPKVKAWD
ncbi:MAG TPA: glycosyltransferase family 39 protein [Bryobacteraceae bacterium]|nr:glycosyltransferase family 39 protein [Bryobacteraceae bacterium]